jgi:hypothetical protein
MRVITRVVSCAFGKIRRMRVFVGVLVAALSISGGGHVFAQGSLTPPGAPAPTMKSLSDIDAHIGQLADKRTAISAPTVITSPGSYYLTTNINAADGGVGITVAADHVTIDLNGFAVIDQGTSGTPNGIDVPDAHIDLCVKNGTVTGFHSHGIGGYVSSSRFEHLIINGNGGAGIIIVGDNSEVLDCVITQNKSGGINVGNGCRVVNSVVSNNAEGIRGKDHVTIESCTLASNKGVGAFVGFAAFVHNCLIRANGPEGINLSGGSRIVDNVVDLNGTNGILTITNASRIDGNSVTYNASYGIDVENTSGVNLIIRNTARG